MATEEEKVALALDKQHNEELTNQALTNTEAMYGTELSWTTPFTEPEPQRADYELNTEMLNKYFPVMSKEEENKRVRKANQYNMWANLANATASLGGLIGTGFGGNAQVVKPAENVDVQTFKNAMQERRATRGSLELGADKQYHTAMDTWRKQKLANETYNAKSLAEYKKLIGKERTRLDAIDKADRAEANKRFIAELNSNTKLRVAMESAKNRKGRSLTGIDIDVEWASIPESERTQSYKGKTPDRATKLSDIKKYYGKSGGNNTGSTQGGSNGGKKGGTTSHVESLSIGG